ncbi:Uncharacterized protein ToN1_34250 [Aromatoleum petrolei]|nr:Uncharacterized protein ToN1_34250 [Aromatoleum petrolei]
MVSVQPLKRGRLRRSAVEQQAAIGSRVFPASRYQVVFHSAKSGAEDCPTNSPSVQLDPATEALERALLAGGLQEQKEVLQLPEMLTLPQASARSGIPLRTLTHMRQNGRLLALSRSGAQKGFRLPAWQFDAAVLDVIADVIEAFGPDRAWQAYDFLTHREPLLADKVPLEELRLGHREAVLRILPAAAGLTQGAL